MDEITVSATVDCPAGGTATITGSGTENGSQDEGGAWDFTFSVTEAFANCVTENQVTVGGSVTLTGEGSGDDTKADISLDVDGDLSITTATVSGTCTLDYGMTLSASQSGATANLSIEFHGTICGIPVEELIARQEG